MSDWKQVVREIAVNVEDHFDDLRGKLKHRLWGVGPIQILPYIGHGTHHKVYIKGRVLEDYDVTGSHDNDTLWANLLNMYRRYNSHEVRYTHVQVTFNGQAHVVETDDEGFYVAELELDTPLPDDQIWFNVDVQLLDYPDQETSIATGKVMVPPHSAQFGVISDLDDTVIQTDVLNLLKMARNTFIYNSRTRLPFPGVAQFYQALQKGGNDTFNPIYYLSSSTWNLYDLFVDFFDVRKVPIGPFFLTDVGLTKDHFFKPGHLDHKLALVEYLLETHPNLPFILVGDSGEKDAEIYLQAIQKHPGRVLAAYIRDVTGVVRDEKVRAIIEKVKEAGSEMLLVSDTAAAAVHAAEHGYILPESLPVIREERKEDKKEPLPVEKLLTPIPENPVPPDNPEQDKPAQTT
jgi:phosphatidate phosphatase APP1